MARPIQADPEDTRRRILAAAGVLFSGQGVAETPLRRIARDAGVSMATIHHYFGGKADLYAACVDAMHVEMDGLRGQLERALSDASVDVRALVDLAIRHAVRFARANRAVVQLTMRTVLDAGQLPADKRERYLLPFLDGASALLAPRLGRDARAIRIALLSINHLITRYTLSSADELEAILGPDALAQVEDHMVELAWHELAGGTTP